MRTHRSGPVGLRVAAAIAAAVVGVGIGAHPALAAEAHPTSAAQQASVAQPTSVDPAGVLLQSVPMSVPLNDVAENESPTADVSPLVIAGDQATRGLADDPACVIGVGEHTARSVQVEVMTSGFFTARLVRPAIPADAEAAQPSNTGDNVTPPSLILYSTFDPAAPDFGVVGCNADYDALRAATADPTEVTDVSIAPVDTAPSDTAPSDTAPSDIAPSETTPSDTAPADAAPAEASAPASVPPLPTFASTLEPGRYTVVVADPADTTLEFWGAADALTLLPAEDAAPNQPAPAEPTPAEPTPAEPAPAAPVPEAPTPAEDPAPLVPAAPTIAAPTITSPAIADVVTAGNMYSRTITADSPEPVEFVVTDGTLPEGLSLDSVTGELAGTPLSEGDVTFTISVSNGGGFTSQAESISVGIAPVIVSIDYPFDAAVGTDYSGSLTAEGTGPITYSLEGALPPGLSFDGSTGVVSGAPTAEGAASITVTATNPFGSVAESADITVGPSPDAPTFVTGSFTQELTAGSDYSILVTGQGTGTLTFSMSRGALPRGLTLNRATGVISGVPTGGGSTFTLALSNAYGTVTQTNTITVTGTATAANSTLPVTGASIDDPAASAGWLVVLGATLVVIARVRRRPVSRR